MAEDGDGVNEQSKEYVPILNPLSASQERGLEEETVGIASVLLRGGGNTHYRILTFRGGGWGFYPARNM